MRSRLLAKIRQRKGLVLLLAVEGFLLLLFPPSLILSSSHIAGGDTPSHLTAAVALRESLATGGPLVTWMHGNYAGYPLFLNYFPFPFFIISLLAAAIPLQIAFKLVTLLPVFGLPAAIYFCLRRFGYADLVAALGSALALPFLVMKENAMWGGNIASTLAGEFCYGIGLVIAVALTGKVFHDIRDGRSLFRNGLLEGLAALSNGYPLLQFGFASSYFLLRGRFIPYIITLHAVAFGIISFWIVPLIARLPWDTSFNHAWKFESWTEPLPVALFPALPGILFGWAAGRAWLGGNGPAGQRHTHYGEAEQYLWWNVGIALACFGLGHAFGLVDIRFLPFAHVFLILLGAIGWGKVLERFRHRGLWTAVAVLLMLGWAAAGSSTVRTWIQWNYSGFEAKPLRQPFEQVNIHLRGTENSPRVVYEHAEENNGAGTVRAFELLPYFSGRSTLEGLYMQSSITSPFVFYLQSELTRTPSCPFPGYYYSRFDADRAAKHLRLFNVRHVVSVSGQTGASLDRSPDYHPEIAFPPFRIHTVVDSGNSYVEPLRFRPHRIPWESWKQTQFEWFRKSSLDVVLVVASENSPGDYWRKLPPYDGTPENLPRVELTDASASLVKASATLEKNRIVVETSTPRHPLWLKISFHPDWRIVEGAGELYLVSPSFMMLVPDTPRVVLRFDTSGGIYAAGRCATLLTGLLTAIVFCLRFGQRRRARARRATGPGADRPQPEIPSSQGEAESPAPGTAQSGDRAVYPVVPAFVWLVLVAAVALYAWHRDERDPLLLYHKALRVYERAEAANSKHGDDTLPGRTPATRPGTTMGEAREWFLRCLNRYPLSPVVDHAAHYVAASYMTENKWQDLTDFYESFLAAYPESRIYPEALYEMGAAASLLGRTDVASRRYWQAVTFFPESERAAAAAARLAEISPPGEILGVAREYYVRKDFFSAYPLLSALSVGPPSPVQTEASLLCAYVLFHQNRWSDSAKTFVDWLRTHRDLTDAPGALVTLGQCYLFMGFHKEAQHSFREALALDPGLANTQPFRALLRTADELARSGGQPLDGGVRSR